MHNLRHIHKESLSDGIRSVKEYSLRQIYSGGAPPRVRTFNDWTLDAAWYRMLRGAYPHYDGYKQQSNKLARGWYVPTGRVLPLGDNRDNSRDGRFFGPVKEKKILGKGVFIYWPGNGSDQGPPPDKNGIARMGMIR